MDENASLTMPRSYSQAVTDEEPIEGGQRLPDWVEREFVRRQDYWRVLRDGGAISETEEAEAIRRETEGLPE